jgi:hypothetical protein
MRNRVDVSHGLPLRPFTSSTLQPFTVPKKRVAKKERLGQNSLIMKRLLFLITLLATIACATLSAQNKIELQAGDTIASILQRSAGQTVELRMKSGEKIGGKIDKTGDKLVYLSQVTGAEYFDAVVDMSDVAAVIVRAKAK